MYKVAHRNGAGILSDYYTDQENILTLEEAKEAARQLRAECPENNGWYRVISVIDEETDTVVFSPDFDH